MNITFDELKEVKSFDVIFVGHLASVAAQLFASTTSGRYNTLVLKQQKSIAQMSLLPLCTNEIKITKRISHPSVQTKQTKILGIKPISKQIEVEGGKNYDYKYLVYSGNYEDWMDYGKIQTLTEALSNQYSLVYSNMKKRDLSLAYKQVSSGNVVFYIPKGRHFGYDNYTILEVHQKLKEKIQNNENLKPLSFKVILEGTDFFPNCKEADDLLKREIHERGIEVSYNSQLTKIDYLRRTLTINSKNQLSYNLLYCVVSQKVPDLLKQSEIEPYQNNPRTLQNNKFRNILIYGADIFPTTHTFESVQYQTHYIVKNLDHLLSKTGEISVYNGYTKIPIYLSSKEVVNVLHYYSKKDICELGNQLQPKVSQNCSWFLMAVEKVTKYLATECYFNYSSFGAPYYIFAPAIKSVPLIREQKIVDQSNPLPHRNSRNIEEGDQEEQMRINKTVSRAKNIDVMVRH